MFHVCEFRWLDFLALVCDPAVIGRIGLLTASVFFYEPELGRRRGWMRIIGGLMMQER